MLKQVENKFSASKQHDTFGVRHSGKKFHITLYIYYIRFLFASNNFCENMIILLALQPRLQDIIDYLRQLGPQGNISFGASQQKRDLFAGSCYII